MKNYFLFLVLITSPTSFICWLLVLVLENSLRLKDTLKIGGKRKACHTKGSFPFLSVREENRPWQIPKILWEQLFVYKYYAFLKHQGGISPFSSLSWSLDKTLLFAASDAETFLYVQANCPESQIKRSSPLHLLPNARTWIHSRWQEECYFLNPEQLFHPSSPPAPSPPAACFCPVAFTDRP